MDKKEQIILAAMKLLIERGAQATPMSAIAKEAGTGMGTIYNYFPTKEDLINAIYSYIKLQEMEIVAVPYDNDSIKKQFEHFYILLIRHLIAHPLHFWFVEQFSASPVIKDSTRDEGLKAFHHIRRFLLRGQEQGIVKPMVIEEMIQFVHGGFKAFIRWALISGKPVTQQLLDDQLRIAWDAIKE